MKQEKTYCDRCGNDLNKDNLEIFMFKYIFIFSETPKSIDLCRNCFKEFKNWVWDYNRDKERWKRR